LSTQERIAAAEAFVVVTPEYNHGYPAPLKALIDSSGAEWYAKPIAFVSYGGISGGLRAVEQLRLVFGEKWTLGLSLSQYLTSEFRKRDPKTSRVTISLDGQFAIYFVGGDRYQLRKLSAQAREFLKNGGDITAIEKVLFES
jgi:NADPH-dependent FMN reductase